MSINEYNKALPIEYVTAEYSEYAEGYQEGSDP